MKQILSLSFAMFVLCIAGYAFGGTADNIQVHLPMAAQMGETKLPAGDYMIHVMDSGSGVPTLEVYSTTGLHILVLANREQVTVSEKSELVLMHQGADFRVSAMRVAGSSYSYSMLPSAASAK